ncbi:MAG: acyl-CoA dehydrogenase family protein [Acidimicrobiia bacterium]
MDFSDTPEDELFRQTLRDYAHKRLLPDYARWRAEPFPRHRVVELGDLGVLGLRVPAEYGGSWGSHVALGIAAEELSRGDFNVSYFIQMAAVSAGLLALADATVAADWLPGVASGERLLAFGLTEPGVGSDAAALTTSGAFRGEEIVVSGEKASITFAGSADACVVFARTGGPGPRGISMVLVPLDRPGVSRHVYASVGGHLSQRGSLFFDEVRVPASYQLGGEGEGFVHAMTAFDFNRAVIALACVGAALQSLEETSDYARERVTFGKSLAEHEGVAFQIAEHLSTVHAARLVAYETLARADAGLSHTTEAAMAKWMGPQWSAEAIHACLRLHGWSGYGEDLPFGQRLADVVGLEIGDGTPEIMKAVIARETFGRALSAYR